MSTLSQRDIYFQESTVQPIPLFAALYVVNTLGGKRQRRPAWRFKVAKDLDIKTVPELPRPHRHGRWVDPAHTNAHQFAVYAGLPSEVAKNGRKVHSVFTESGTLLSGEIVDRDGQTNWRFRATNLQWPRDANCDFSEAVALRARVLQTLESMCFHKLDPRMFYANECIVCDKELSDPVSKSRLIGSDCWARIRKHGLNHLAFFDVRDPNGLWYGLGPGYKNKAEQLDHMETNTR